VTAVAAADLARFVRDGCLHLRSSVPRGLVQDAARAADAVVASTTRAFGRCKDCDGVHHDFEVPHCGFARRPFIQMFNVWAEHPAFRALALCDELRDLGRALLGCAEVRLLLDQLLLKRPGDEPTELHVDAFHWPLTGRACTIWIPLSKVTPEMGTMSYYPGSHRVAHAEANLGALTYDTLSRYTAGWVADHGFAARELAAELVPGDVAIHDGWMAHRAGGNASSSVRTVLAVHLIDAQARRRAARNELEQGQADMFHWQGIPPDAILRVPMCPVL